MAQTTLFFKVSLDQAAQMLSRIGIGTVADPMSESCGIFFEYTGIINEVPPRHRGLELDRVVVTDFIPGCNLGDGRRGAFAGDEWALLKYIPGKGTEIYLTGSNLTRVTLLHDQIKDGSFAPEIPAQRKSFKQRLGEAARSPLRIEALRNRRR